MASPLEIRIGSEQNERIRRFAEPAALGAGVLSVIGAGLTAWNSYKLGADRQPTMATTVARGLGAAAGLALAHFGRNTANVAANQLYDRNRQLETDQ